MVKIRITILIIIIFIIADIILQNPNAITINFLWWEFSMSIFAMPVIVIISVAAGYLIAKMRKKSQK